MPPTVNLDPLRKLARDIQDRYPAIRTALGVIEAAAPDLADRVRELDENLPHVVAGVVAEAESQVRSEVRAAARPAARALGRFIDDALVRAGERVPKRKRLRAKGTRK